ncbi:TPA: BolA/IbaG family iron-sulfur metabolism protein [Legionella feeleii]|uniref:BolA like protein n=2 Tax=Legionella TaxID=445 RepID=A0A0W0U9X9_9GAMM|nr:MULTISPECIES: BolA/IbaG family iron-sulfur metabolism protein [Legionella]KTD04329.1 BolA like protein [Legionella feeleii]SPX62876.1 BolA like protein [Legionella feeleii]STX38080.1 BolA like protein [Legionella feeleii]STX42999.1 BolA like protein [Legionella donaldsonii]
MVSNEELERRLAETGEVDFVKVEGDGYHYQLTIVSNAFLDKSKVARQQWVYSKLKDYITTGSLHALSMKTWTKEEWETSHG